ncbi:trypsin-like peptidase domain-containing protein [Rhodohalobacter sulfatireducens]|uniref:Trypsin-like peptidase domain-containing protein n=1 Tax=Rhodohalobacter sulfatireducens TaxID=2911366 RepID=A0ABS9KJ84_9BACT|nr:trypsin-like peptidase domain-containing protein [Rhodohalobacter sulfatireducens]MCG2590886.1 trypsin-like peptidase domain-containing protein [Rhodohalobacter sulfatireducens]
MKFRDKILSGILLILIGIMLGMILMLFRTGSFPFDLAEVQVTEVNRSTEPAWSDEDLEKIDDRFLFQSAAKQITPTVVYVETIVTNRNRGREEDIEEEDGFWERFLPPRARTVGSGVLITKDGYILTNNHVIEDAVRDGISVTLNDKRSFDARVVGRDPSTDLAVLKIDANNLPAAVIGNSDEVDVGEWVLAVGNPFRLRSTVTAGIVGALSRDVQIINDDYRIESFIQTDAAINRGNSGGALVNTSGELIGINTAIATQSGSYQGYGFAVPSNLALKIARDIIEFGEPKRGLLGIQIITVDSQTAERIGMDEIRGVMISGVPGNPAEDAGLQPDDVILAVNGETVDESNLLQERVAMFRPNDQVTLTIWREGQTFDRVLTLEERPEQEPLASRMDVEEEEELDEWEEIPESGYERGIEHQRFDIFGFTLRALSTPEDPDTFNIYFYRVQPNSEAWNKGIREGDELLELNGAGVKNMDGVENEISNSLKNNRSLDLKLQTTDGAIGFYKLN